MVVAAVAVSVSLARAAAARGARTAGLRLRPDSGRPVAFGKVAGIVITTIGLTLMPVAGRWAMGGNSRAEDFGSTSNILLAGVTLAIVLLLSRQSPRPVLQGVSWSVLPLVGGLFVMVEALAKTKGVTFENGNFKNISMGQGQEKPAEAVVETFAKNGGWVSSFRLP